MIADTLREYEELIHDIPPCEVPKCPATDEAGFRCKHDAYHKGNHVNHVKTWSDNATLPPRA